MSKDWDWDWISGNPNLQLKWLIRFPDKKWYWGQSSISNNPNVILEWVERFPDKDWYWSYDGLSSNPNLKLEWIEKYPDKLWEWNSIKLSYNTIFEEKAIKYMAAYRIQQWWYKITLSPVYVVGRKFINRKYDEMFL